VKCSACGSKISAAGDGCRVCEHASKGGYAASIETGLKRLEREKLVFLGEPSLVSKYDVEHVARFAQLLNTDDTAEWYEDELSEIRTLVEAGGTFERDTLVEVRFPATAVGLVGRGDDISRPLPAEAGEENAPDRVQTQLGVLTCEDSVQSLSSGDVVLDGRGTGQPAGIQAMSPGDYHFDEVGGVRAVQSLDEGDFFIEQGERRPRHAKVLRSDFKPVAVVDAKAAAAHSAIEKLRAQGVFFDAKPHPEVEKSFGELFDLERSPPPSARAHGPGISLEENAEAACEDEAGEACHPQDTQDSCFSLFTDDGRQAEREACLAKEAEKQTEEDVSLENPPVALSLNVRGVSDELSLPSVSMADLPRRRAGAVGVIWTTMVVVLLAGILYLLYAMGLFAGLSPWLDPRHWAKRDVIALQDVADDEVNVQYVRKAVDSARRRVQMAFDFDAYFPEFIKEEIAVLSERDLDSEQAHDYRRTLYAMYPGNVESLAMLVSEYIRRGEFSVARDFIREAPDRLRFAPEIASLWLLSFESDPEFISPIYTIDDAQYYDEIAPLGGGSTLTFRPVVNGQNAGALKPLQTRRQSNYRAEIASWRLCELLDCAFKIPHNREVRIEYNAFMAMFNRSRSRKVAEYRPQLVDLIWTTEDGKRYLHATLKAWVPDFTRFPIEFLSLWRPWLSLANDFPEGLSLSEALAPLSTRDNTRKLLPKILQQAPTLTTAGLANQISQVLTFDFLVGNWDRFSGVPSWWGVNCQFKGNAIVSIDNGAAFQPYGHSKVTEHFMSVERFSASFIDELRALDKETTYHLLFPDASVAERVMFERFWTQRSAVLSRVDSLIETHGSERVLAFD